MRTERLRYMAEQIARNLAVQGPDVAAAATAEHIRLYWDPRMRAALLADDRAALSPVVAAAVEELAAGNVVPDLAGDRRRPD